jgi:MFS family permease
VAGRIDAGCKENSMAAAVRTILKQYSDLPATVHILCLGTLLNRAGSFVMLFLTIYVTQQLGASARFASFCVSAFGVGSILSSLIGGQLADQIGRRRTLLLALFGGAAALVGLSLVRTPWVFMSVLFLFALVMEMYRPAAAAMVGDVTTPAQRPHAYGLMFLSINLGFSFAPPIGGALAERSFQWLFWGDAITTALYGMVIWLFIRESVPHGRDDSATAGVPEADLGTALRHIAGNRTFLAFTLCHLITLVVFMQGFTTLPLHVTNMGFTTEQFGQIICVNGILIVLLQVPLTHLLRHFNRAWLLLAGEILLATGFGLTVLAGSASALIGTIALWTLGEILQAPYKQTIVSELAPPELRGRYMGVFNLAFAVSLTIAPPVGAEVLRRFGPWGLWPGCFGLLMVTTAMYFGLFRALSSPRRAAEGDLHPDQFGRPVAAGKLSTAELPSESVGESILQIPEPDPCESLIAAVE